MANEAVIVELLGDQGDVVEYTVFDGLQISQGALCGLSDARTLSGSPAAAMPFAGIASAEKVSGDGSTKLGVWTNCVADLLTSSTIVAGHMVQISGGDNQINSGLTAVQISAGHAFGKAMETSASGTAETIQVRVLC